MIALVAYGGGETSTVAAVLLYRIISFWAFLPVGWLVWGGSHIAEPPSRPARPHQGGGPRGATRRNFPTGRVLGGARMMGDVRRNRRSRATIATFAVIVVTGGAAGGLRRRSQRARHSHDSVCFRVYPEALAAVHHHGQFAGTRYLPPRALIVVKHRTGVPDALVDAARVATCLVAFTGHFLPPASSSAGLRAASRAGSRSS